ncbi:hypothetical protein [Salinactinospora qingdaonensis]
MASEHDPKNEIASSLRAGRELGPDYDDAIAASLAQRLEATIDERIGAHLAQHPAAGAPHPGKGVSPTTLRLVMGIVTLGVAIPVTIVAAVTVGSWGILMSWVGLIAFYLLVVRGAGN